MELKHQLAGQLRHLRLSGVLETLDARNRQAIDDKWSYLEFLARILEDEVDRRSQKQLSLRLRRGALNSTKTLEGFDFDFNPNLNRQQVLELATCQFIRDKHNLLLCGPTGVGKSHLAQALGQESARQGFDVLHHRPEDAPAPQWRSGRWHLGAPYGRLPAARPAHPG